MSYELTWVTDQLAVGHAPMSYEQLDSIKEQGIGAIVNLCAEFCDLHELEENAGFEVYYLPIHDECIPEMEAMEKALHWFDEAIYLKKKILVHCRHGIGRTGTFVSAYLLRRGLGLKLVKKALKPTRANPSNYSQWKLLKKYSKQQGQLKVREASIHNDNNTIDLNPFFSDYQAIIDDYTISEAENVPDSIINGQCCHEYFEMYLIEAVFVNHHMNLLLSSAKREETIHDAVMKFQTYREYKDFSVCPLLEDGKCQIFSKRPIHCRQLKKSTDQSIISKMIDKLSRDVFFSLTNSFPPEKALHFSILDTVSGRFVQHYFQAMLQISGK
jgi:protein-tyrosine phosphatase